HTRALTSLPTRRSSDLEVKDDLTSLFSQKGDIVRNQLTFTNCGMTLKNFKDAEDFVKNYPFAPYQFQLVQKIFEAIRRAGATGRSEEHTSELQSPDHLV